MPPSTCRALQVEGCKMPSICELPQGSAPGNYFTATRRLMLTSCSTNFRGLSEPEPVATVRSLCARSSKPWGSCDSNTDDCAYPDPPLLPHPQPPMEVSLSLAGRRSCRSQRCDSRHSELCLLFLPPWDRQSVPEAGAEPSWKEYRELDTEIPAPSGLDSRASACEC